MGRSMENTWHLFDSMTYQLISLSISLATVPSLFLHVFQSNKVPVVQHPHHMHPLTPLITYSSDHFPPGSPPTHLSPEIDPKTGESAAAGGAAPRAELRGEPEGQASPRSTHWTWVQIVSSAVCSLDHWL